LQLNKIAQATLILDPFRARMTLLGEWARKQRLGDEVHELNVAEEKETCPLVNT
jgi:hypothetical protein